MTREDATPDASRCGKAASIEARIREFLLADGDDVFLRCEFNPFGSVRQVGRVLLRLQTDGTLVKLGVGIYAKAKMSVLSNKPIPVKPIEVLAPLALRKLGIAVTDAPLVALYNSGMSTQIPAGVAFSTGTRLVTRQVGFNGKTVEFVRTKK